MFPCKETRVRIPVVGIFFVFFPPLPMELLPCQAPISSADTQALISESLKGSCRDGRSLRVPGSSRNAGRWLNLIFPRRLTRDPPNVRHSTGDFLRQEDGSIPRGLGDSAYPSPANMIACRFCSIDQFNDINTSVPIDNETPNHVQRYLIRWDSGRHPYSPPLPTGGGR